MLFNSPEFFVFFPVVTAIYFALPHRFRWIHLLIASYFFYMCWKPGYVTFLAITTAVDYAAALRIEAADTPGRRRAWLLLSLTANFGLLFYFKYYNFFADSLEPLIHRLGLHIDLPHSSWLLPVGISFYTFQSVAYTLDVYRREMPAERHLGRFALYVSFFPQLVAGPIERAAHLLPQFKVPVLFEYDRVSDGLKLMLWGLIKKVVIADRLALLVNHVFSQPETASGPALALAILFFSFQIYCDFSGYTDIARGAASVLGIQLMENFRRPYFAASITEFWRRWHISLSTWFRDYVYRPLGGNRVPAFRWAINILIVFLVSGLWHGASWKFVVWGLIHGTLLLVENALRRAFPAGHTTALSSWLQPVKVLFTFVLVALAWVFFRANTFGDALHILTHLHLNWAALLEPGFLSNAALGQEPRDFCVSLALIGFLLAVEAVQTRSEIRTRIAAWPAPLRWAVYSLGLWMLFLLGMMRQNEFIYFVF